jgi:hypothetical protein
MPNSRTNALRRLYSNRGILQQKEKMDRSSSHEQLVKEIVDLANASRLKVHRKFNSSRRATCIGFSGGADRVPCQKLAEKIKSATGHDYWQEQKPGSEDLVFHFPTIEDKGW